ncbi:hypothetical protein C0993_002298, partial [Termitomyces sp. T159_Od127]
MTDPDNCHNRDRNNRSVVVAPLDLRLGNIGSEGMRSGGNMGSVDMQPIGSAIRQPAVADDLFAVVIPKTHLPEGWDAPLQNPMPKIVPPPPPPPMQRRVNRQRQAATINAVLAPVLTRGDIAHRERMANLEARHQQAVAALQEQQRIRHMAEEQARQQ